MKISIYKYCRICIFLLLGIFLTILSGCANLVLLHPKGQIGSEECSLVLTAFGLMSLIIIPVIVMTFFFTLKYRASNFRNAQYTPNWSHSKIIEFVIWFVPIIIIIILGILTWKSTHKLDPKKPIVSAITQPIIVDVISLDWKWLFIYPQQNIAVVNELVFPINTPIKFNVTSNSVMNAFFIPQLGGQIYAMAGMHTELNLIAQESGQYKGISSNFSGSGFSNMKFTVIVTDTEKEFEKWIKKVRQSPYHINNMITYEELAAPSKNNAVIYFSSIQTNLFYEVINKFKY
ncbi:ubiquinol oxidase subunit II [Candidatus Blochmannia ocreatus (nom. nud.)]|uniref:Ubiquinol oxidase subunit 2 n=1 Tax=Candidatus Blochmannia ocreatus (nom. nud.) TaxID=251538 RepID=A0ABY4SVD8_9ENTR|nr:ubiquinol oxidase subunit II [Candidatus Blochmannia ocreatus]URJ25312.1 ubiquinol oxidase subunit II [Candidatus Blochmannia ocreatus]